MYIMRNKTYKRKSLGFHTNSRKVSKPNIYILSDDNLNEDENINDISNSKVILSEPSKLKSNYKGLKNNVIRKDFMKYINKPHIDCKGLTTDECEEKLLKQSIENITQLLGRKMSINPNIEFMIKEIETFIKDKKIICYGGTAVNNLLPESLQFYDKKVSLPDYDCYSKTPVEDIKEIADIFKKKGFKQIEAKSGLHEGTYKLFVEFIPLLDLTKIDTKMYNKLQKDSITKDGIVYAPPLFLIMGMFLELARPRGDVSRWAKINQRLNLFLSMYSISSQIKCINNGIIHTYSLSDTFKKVLLNFTRNIKGILIGKEILKKFLNMKKKHYNTLKLDEFIVIHENPTKVSDMLIGVIEKMDEFSKSKVTAKVTKYNNELIPYIISVQINNITCYKIIPTTSCYSYNNINMKGHQYKIASIETIFTVYIYMLYMIDDKEHVNSLKCILIELYTAFLRNKSSQTGTYSRFSLNCKGYQETKTDFMAKKNDMYIKLQEKKDDPLIKKKLDEVFLKYIPR